MLVALLSENLFFDFDVKKVAENASSRPLIEKSTKMSLLSVSRLGFEPALFYELV